MLRRGPQRAVQDAITTLGDIPILRPRPQRATDSSFDDQSAEPSEQTTPSPRARADSVRGPMSTSEIEEMTPASVDSPAPSSLRILHLPFRLGRAHKNSPTRLAAAEHRTHGDASSPSHTASQSAVTPTNSVNSAEPDQRASPTRPASRTSQAELRGGGRTPPPFPCGDDDRGPPDHTSDPESTSDPENPTLRLKSYLDERREWDDRPRFTIHEVWTQTQGWQTEPCRPREHMPTHMRSLSSGTAPTFGLSMQPQDHSATAFDARRSVDDVFGTRPARQSSASLAYHPDNCGSQQDHPPAGTSRRFSSEASAASGAYSFYELPPMSRQVSGSQPGSHDTARPQYDGSAAAAPASRGAYHSLRPSNAPMFGSTEQLPRHVTAAGQYSVSPLPSFPYNRHNTHAVSPAPSQTRAIASARVSSQASVGQWQPAWHDRPSTPPGYQSASPGNASTQQLPVWNGRLPLPSGYQVAPPGHSYTNVPVQRFTPSTGYIDAASAAMQGRPSPLDPYSEYYQHHLSQQNARPPPTAQPVAPYPIDRYSAGSRHSATDAARSSTSRSQNSHVRDLYGAPNGRNAHTARSNQRSSENAHARPSAQSSDRSHNSQVQRHREVFEAMHSLNPSDTLQPGPSRLSLPPPTAPRDASNLFRAPDWNRPAGVNMPWRRTAEVSSSPISPTTRRPSARLDPSAPTYRPSASPDLPPMISPSNGPNMRGGAAPDRTQTRARRRVTPARSPNHLHLPRASLPLHHAVSLRSPLLHAANPVRPIRRVPPQQRDQENSGAGEEQLMRQEAAAMRARYGEDVQRGDVMDETPPRVGRVERRMFS